MITPEDKSDAKGIAAAFLQMYSAAMKINEILGRNRTMNESVPTGWPIPFSADDFAFECQGMAEHYAELAK